MCSRLVFFHPTNVSNMKYIILLLGILNACNSCADTDFETGTISPWVEESNSHENGPHWIIEDSASDCCHNPAPRPSHGSKYLRLRQGKFFGVTALRSPPFRANPGDAVSFSYWIRSKFYNFNNIQVSLILAKFK